MASSGSFVFGRLLFGGGGVLETIAPDFRFPALSVGGPILLFPARLPHVLKGGDFFFFCGLFRVFCDERDDRGDRGDLSCWGVVTALFVALGLWRVGVLSLWLLWPRGLLLCEVEALVSSWGVLGSFDLPRPPFLAPELAFALDDFRGAIL